MTAICTIALSVILHGLSAKWLIRALNKRLPAGLQSE
jgi:NhaP-type Na+/H+ or K+/H+ antiporter